MIDELNERYGRLTVVALAERRSAGQAVWVCKCDCGGTTEATGANLRNGRTQSCGCLQKERASASSLRHGEARDGAMTGVYRVWIEMWQRCTNPKSQRWHSHGARGIRVCDRWKDYETFRDDMGPRPPRHSIERRDNDGNYDPSNCYWASAKEQARNKRTTIRVTLNGVTKPLTQWCEELGIKATTVRYRLRKGLSPEESLR